MLVESKDKASKKLSTKLWGTEDRFKDPKKTKSQSVVNPPGAG